MATDDIKVILGAVDNVTRVVDSIDRRLNKIAKTTRKVDFAASLTQAVAPAKAVATVLNFASDSLEIVNTKFDHWTDQWRAMIGAIPIVGGAMEKFIATVIKVDPVAKSLKRAAEAMNVSSDAATNAAKFTKQLDRQLQLRNDLLDATDAADQAILRLSEDERQQLAEVDAQRQKLERTRGPQEAKALDRLNDRKLELQRTFERERQRIITDSREKFDADVKKREDDRIAKQLAAEKKRAKKIADIEFETQQARLRIAGDTEEAMLEAIRHRSDVAIAEAKRAGDAEQVEKLKTLRLVQQQEVLAQRKKKTGGLTSADLTPNLAIQSSRLGRIAQDPGQRAAQQTAANTKRSAQVLQQIAQNQQSGRASSEPPPVELTL